MFLFRYGTVLILVWIGGIKFTALPGWEPQLGGFPALSSAGGFLVKDLILLGAALWSLGESLTAVDTDPVQTLQRASSEMMAQATGR